MKILNKSFIVALLVGCNFCGDTEDMYERIENAKVISDDLAIEETAAEDEKDELETTAGNGETATIANRSDEVGEDGNPIEENSGELVLPQSLKETLNELGDTTARVMHPNIGLVVEKIQEICERISETCDDPAAKELSDKIQSYLTELGQHCLEGDPENYSKQNLDRSLLLTCEELKPLFDETFALIELYKGENPSPSRIWHVKNNSKVVKILMGIIKSGEAYRARTPDLSPQLLFVMNQQIKEAALKLRPFRKYSKKLRKDFKNQPGNSLNWLLIMVEDPVFIVKRSNVRLIERAIQAKYEEISIKLNTKPGFEKIRQEFLQATYALWLYELKVHCMCCIHMHEVIKKFAQVRRNKNLPPPKLSSSNKFNFMHGLRSVIIQSRGTIDAADADHLIEMLTRIQQHTLRGFKDHGIIENSEILAAWKTTAEKFSGTRVSKSLYTLYEKYRENLEKVESNKSQ